MQPWNPVCRLEKGKENGEMRVDSRATISGLNTRLLIREGSPHAKQTTINNIARFYFNQSLGDRVTFLGTPKSRLRRSSFTRSDERTLERYSWQIVRASGTQRSQRFCVFLCDDGSVVQTTFYQVGGLATSCHRNRILDDKSPSGLERGTLRCIGES